MSPQTKFRLNNSDRVKDIERRSKLRRKYGITLEDKRALEVKQNSMCAICPAQASTELRGLFIDHNHNTGKIRGLLCNSCNRGLGYFRDNPDLLKKAEVYLREHT